MECGERKAVDVAAVAARMAAAVASFIAVVFVYLYLSIHSCSDYSSVRYSILSMQCVALLVRSGQTIRLSSRRGFIELHEKAGGCCGCWLAKKKLTMCEVRLKDRRYDVIDAQCDRQSDFE